MVKRVTADTEEMRFNTAISAMMEFVNAASKWENKPRTALEPFILALAPYAPHIAEELWERAGHDETLAYEPWPTYDEELLVEKTVALPVQVIFPTSSFLDIVKEILAYYHWAQNGSCRDVGAMDEI